MYSDSSPCSERTLMKKIFQGVSEANDKMIGYFSFDTPSYGGCLPGLEGFGLYILCHLQANSNIALLYSLFNFT